MKYKLYEFMTHSIHFNDIIISNYAKCLTKNDLINVHHIKKEVEHSFKIAIYHSG